MITTQKSGNVATISILNSTIQAVTIAQNLVPLELGKGVLSTVIGVLTLVRDTMQNNDDFLDVADQCHRIGFILWRATSETPEQEISPSIRQGIVDLKVALEGIQESLESKAHRGIGGKIFYTSFDRRDIASWKSNLDRSLVLLNTELHIAAHVKLDEIIETLKNARPHQSTPVPDPLPALPAIFFGRNDIIEEVSNSLLDGKHVALIGPGGIGKSCIARAVLHEELILKTYGEHRYFVRYDDINYTQITLGTFLHRIAQALGITSLKTNLFNLVSKFLSSHKTLVVLDNAETFLDTAQDSGHISDTIDELGALPDVVFMLTTRTKALPPNFICKKFTVPPLEQSAALKAFWIIYGNRIPDHITVRLLSELDFHPLSINLLAQAAVQNEWSSENLVQSWEQQKAHILEIGHGKVQSLAITIELSLNSPSISNLGTNALHILQIAAFLPQGIDKQKIVDLFPGISDVQSIVDQLCRQSLLCHRGSFITMLAPIRLYISSKYNEPVGNIMPLLKHLRSYYCKRILKTTDVNEFLETNSAVVDTGILFEDVNIEHLVAFDLATSHNKERSLSFCVAFLKNLKKSSYSHPTALQSIIQSISDNDLSHKKIGKFYVLNPFVKKHCLFLKASCLMYLGYLTREQGQSKDTIKLFLAAQEIFSTASDYRSLAMCQEYIADEYIGLGQFIAAENVLKGALEVAHKIKDLERQASIGVNLGRVMLYRGKPGYAKLFIKSCEYFESVKNHYMAHDVQFKMGLGEIYAGNYKKAKQHFSKHLTFSQSIEDSANAIVSLVRLAMIAFESREIVQAYELLDKAQELSQLTGRSGDLGYTLALKALIAADQNNFNLAQQQIKKAISEASIGQNIVNDYLMMCVYLSACISLAAGDYDDAKISFITSIELCEDLSDIRFKARSIRGLGEIAFMEQKYAEAKERFSEAKSLCEFMGISPGSLYVCAQYLDLKDNFNGWKLFQEEKIPAL